MLIDEREKNTISNLRFRWKKELEPYSDFAVIEVYEEFSMSVDFGNNDEKFPEWFQYLADAEEIYGTNTPEVSDGK